MKEFDWLTQGNKEPWGQVASALAVSLGSVGNKLLAAKEFSRRLMENQLDNQKIYDSMRGMASRTAQNDQLRRHVAENLGVEDTPDAVFDAMLKFAPEPKEKESSTSYAQRAATAAKSLNESVFKETAARDAYIAMAMDSVNDGILHSDDVFKKAENMRNYQELDMANAELEKIKTYEELEALKKKYKKFDFNKTEKGQILARNKRESVALDLLDKYRSEFDAGVFVDVNGVERLGYHDAMASHAEEGGDPEDMKTAIQYHQAIEAHKGYQEKRLMAKTKAELDAYNATLDAEAQKLINLGKHLANKKLEMAIDQNNPDNVKNVLYKFVVLDADKAAYHGRAKSNYDKLSKELEKNKGNATLKKQVKDAEIVLDALVQLEDDIRAKKIRTFVDEDDPKKQYPIQARMIQEGNHPILWEKAVEDYVNSGKGNIASGLRDAVKASEIQSMSDGTTRFTKYGKRYHYDPSTGLVERLGGSATKQKPSGSRPPLSSF